MSWKRISRILTTSLKQLLLAKKSRQDIEYNPQKVHRFRPSIGVTITRTDEILDSFKEELSKVVLKWLSGNLGVDRKDTDSQIVTFTSNGPTGPNPPSKPQNINIVNVIVSCPNVQNSLDELTLYSEKLK